MLNEYKKQACDFLEKTNTKIEIEFLKHDFHFADDKEKRDIYKITIKRGEREFSFEFGNSIANSGFYLKCGVRISPIDRKFLNVSDAELKFNCFKYNLPSDIISKDKIFRPIAPKKYDILACLTKYDCGNFEEFCLEFGYDEDSRKAEKTYNAVKEEFSNVQKIWTDEEIEFLREIN